MIDGRKIDTIVIHASASQAKSDWGVAELRRVHMVERGWSDVGYHYVITRTGKTEQGRSIQRKGAHVKGHNKHSIGVCLIGGIDEQGNSEDNFCDEQYLSLQKLLFDLCGRLGSVEVICGHRDLSPDRNNDGEISQGEWLKDCPCFDVQAWLDKINFWEEYEKNTSG